MATWEHLWISKHTSPKDVNFWNGIGLISVDLQNNLQVIYMRGGFNWVFHPFVGHTLQGIMEIRAMGI
jgi:hypothetical protein